VLVAAAILAAGITVAVVAFRGNGGTAPTTAATTTVPTTTPRTTPTTTPAAAPSTPAGKPLTIGLPDTGKLRRVDTGPLVRRLQRALKALGNDPGPVDGDFGPLTEAAVVAFQSANGLDQDGVVGPKTAAKLDAALAAKGITA
jgi:peptidoglycan hydrolase-like protein with peptidoglycan-binding domain